MLTSISWNDVQTTIIHMAGNVIVTRLDSSYKWKINSLKHARCSFQASGAEKAISIQISAREIQQMQVWSLWLDEEQEVGQGNSSFEEVREHFKHNKAIIAGVFKAEILTINCCLFKKAMKE